ncbi:MAG TPA: polyprenyl synthetase family protein [Herpetosiphonaceae bacterium]|nr:polyprenyl synthetase family protein [Herpetosiphonaceae bacterium]
MTEQNTTSRLRDAMAAAFPSYSEWLDTFYGMAEYHLGWRDEYLQTRNGDAGKLIRPRLCLLGCQVVGGSETRVLPLAAAIQLLHDHTLVHDDIQDGSDLRRGRPTVWRLWGVAHGISVGDALCVLSHRALFQMANAGVPASLILTIERYFDDMLLHINEGQHLDLSFERRFDIDEDDYLAMIERKTAALIAASLYMGALVGGGNVATAEALEDFGTFLGLTYQIQDDVLGIWGDPTQTGKPVADDLYDRKKSFPIVYALTHAGASDRSLLHSIYSQSEIGEREIELLLAILERSDARRHTEELADHYSNMALAALERVPEGDPAALAQLRALAEGLVGRPA